MKKNKIYTTSSIFAGVSLILIVFLIWPLLKNIEKNSEDLILAKSSIVALAQQTDEVENFKESYEAYRSDFAKIDHLFVDPLNPVDFIEFLESAASNSEVTSQVSLSQSSTEAKQFITYQFFSRGSFDDLLDFTKKIETGPYLLEIVNLNIQSATISRNGLPSIPNGFDATFTIKVFTKK